MSKLDWWKTAYVVFLMCAATAIAFPAQIFTTLLSFDYRDGYGPQAALVQGTDGNLYGTTENGGAHESCVGEYTGCGTVFRMDPNGKLRVLYSFCSQSGCTDGASPFGGVVQGTDGSFYGTTYAGGANGAQFGGEGTVFKITPNGTLTTLYSFCSQSNCTDGLYPSAGLMQATDGNFYGTTASGGAYGGGTVFKITPKGTLTTLYSFCSRSLCPDGVDPQAGLIQATDGSFYGTTVAGGAPSCSVGDGNGCGTIFKITPNGKLTTLYSFCPQENCPDGRFPLAGLVQGTDRSFYGTTWYGGANGEYYGTVFKVTTSGRLTTLHSFCSQGGCPDGQEPRAALVQATDGDFYGTTSGGGATSRGTGFKITPSGTLTTLHSFCAQTGCTDGYDPWAGLVQDTGGNFYGDTIFGGTSSACVDGCGTVFSLAVGLGPFVKTQPAGGKVGAAIKILGTNLTGATSITFNGTPATFTVEASSVIKATVPAGATTGTVQVVTPSGTLSSSAPFRVAP